jgi:hypothetical protein
MKDKRGGQRDGAGRKPLPPDARMVAKGISLRLDQWEHVERSSRYRSRYLQELVDRDMKAIGVR